MKKTHKFGIEMPKSAKHALELDAKNGKTMWAEEISKEKKNIEVYFEILDNDTPPPVGHQNIECHMIFDEWFQPQMR